MSTEFQTDYQCYQPASDNFNVDLGSDDLGGFCSVDATNWGDSAPWTTGNSNLSDVSMPVDVSTDSGSATPAGCVDISWNDVTMGLGSIINFVPALLIRGAMAVVPDLADSFLPDHRSVFGTAGKDGPVGWLVGDSDKNSGTPGVLGIAASLAGWSGIWGDFAAFEKGGLRHNGNTGENQKSQPFSSIGETIGQGVGILARHMGIGRVVDSLVRSILGEPDGYGFVNGVQSGSWVKAVSADDDDPR